MKLAVLICTRNRPLLLTACITLLDNLKSGDHDISYVAGYDHDDSETPKAINYLRHHHLYVHSQLLSDDFCTQGERWNSLAENTEADYYFTMGDDIFAITRNWDKVALAQNEECISWRSLASSEHDFLVPVMTRKFVKALGYMFPPHFPYWFCDTWLQEIYRYAFNKNPLVSNNLLANINPDSMDQIRDLDFWWGFFHATRRMRINDARRIAKAYQVDHEQFDEQGKHWAQAGIQRDFHFRGERIKHLEGLQPKKPPRDNYVRAKAKAEKFLSDNNLTIWQTL